MFRLFRMCVNLSIVSLKKIKMNKKKEAEINRLSRVAIGIIEESKTHGDAIRTLFLRYRSGHLDAETAIIIALSIGAYYGTEFFTNAKQEEYENK